MNTTGLKGMLRRGVCGPYLLLPSLCVSILVIYLLQKEPSSLASSSASPLPSLEYIPTLGSSLKILKPNHFQSANLDYSCVPYRLPWDYTPSMRLCIYPDEQDPSISLRVRKYLVWEPHLVAMTILALKMNEGKNETERISLVDIGCNIGTFTVPAASLGFEVVGVDANEQNFQLVDRSLRVNNLNHLVTLVHNALAETRQKVLIRYCLKCSPGRAVITPNQKYNPSEEHVSEVMAVTLNDIIPLVRTRRVVIKMDIEASEGRALRGGAEFFDRLTVEGVLMEWGNVKRRFPDRDFIFTFMAERGYRAFKSPFAREPLDTSKNMSWPENIYWRK